MISKTSFLSGMERIADARGYSKKEKFRQQMEVYFSILETRLGEVQFNNTVDFLLMHGSKFPDIREILEVSRNFPEPKLSRIQSDCPICESKGTLIASQNIRGKVYRSIFKCPECQNCLSLYPEWSKDFKLLGYKLDCQDSEWNSFDELQIKGLIFMGEESFPYKISPQKMKDAVSLHRNKSVGVSDDRSINEKTNTKTMTCNPKMPIHLSEIEPDIF